MNETIETIEIPAEMLDTRKLAKNLSEQSLIAGYDGGCSGLSEDEAMDILEAAGVSALIRARDGFRDTVTAQHEALAALHSQIAGLKATLDDVTLRATERVEGGR